MSKFRLNPSKPKLIVGVAMIFLSIGFVVAMLSNILDSSLDGNARGFAVVGLFITAVGWVPALIGGFALVVDRCNVQTARRPKQFECPTRNQSMSSMALFCPHFGSEAHRATNCHSCSAPRPASHSFCRAFGAQVA